MSFNIIRNCVILCVRRGVGAGAYRKFSSNLSSVSEKSVLRNNYFLKHCTPILNVRFLSAETVNKESDLKSTTPKQERDPPSTLQKKRVTLRRKQHLIKDDSKNKQGVWNVKAISTAEGYDLESLRAGLTEQQLYIPYDISVSSTSLSDVIHTVARYGTQDEPREIFFFREGAIVLWNVPDLECGNILNFLKDYEENPHAIDLIKSESELMTYCHSPQGRTSAVKNGCFVLGETTTVLEKYTFSNVMLLSVKLGISESTLDNYIHSIEFVTQDLRAGKRLKLTQHEVLRKQGQLFALRHEVNLSSDLLDTPDFYWERDDLEVLYHQACNYFSISKRTKVINDKLNHCLELVGLLSTHLSDRHHVRLEWMIIVLIMVEVAFETLHYIDRYFS